jgi:hypothetical protein
VQYAIGGRRRGDDQQADVPGTADLVSMLDSPGQEDNPAPVAQFADLGRHLDAYVVGLALARLKGIRLRWFGHTPA